MARKEFEMSQEQLEKLLEACKPVPLIMLQCGTPPSRQETVNAAWKALGKEMGFNWETVTSCHKGDRYFTAEVINKDE